MSEYIAGRITLSSSALDKLSKRLNNPTEEQKRNRAVFLNGIEKNVHIVDIDDCSVVAEIDDFDDSFMDSFISNDSENGEWQLSITYPPLITNKDFYFTINSNQPDSFSLKNETTEDEWVDIYPNSLIA